MMSRFLDALAQRVLIYDGAMGTSIQAYQPSTEDYGGPSTEGCNEYLVLTKPALIEEIHTGFLEAGCDVLECDSFTASRLKLDEYGLG
nr:homocysteine S-methyltransferase family protein [Chloroflexota bacterium]